MGVLWHQPCPYCHIDFGLPLHLTDNSHHAPQHTAQIHTHDVALSAAELRAESNQAESKAGLIGKKRKLHPCCDLDGNALTPTSHASATLRREQLRHRELVLIQVQK